MTPIRLSHGDVRSVSACGMDHACSFLVGTTSVCAGSKIVLEIVPPRCMTQA
ncbi:hypothetical protein [Lysobacter gummosus]|uniref:hypothetical protein n=1 Tax=Lysobacter gummosus TaxID=262324 RepID=UPI00364001E7